MKRFLKITSHAGEDVEGNTPPLLVCYKLVQPLWNQFDGFSEK